MITSQSGTHGQMNLSATKRWLDAHPEKRAEYVVTHRSYLRRYHLQRAYGLSPAQYAEMLARQNGRCAMCKALPGKRNFHVDHNHTTGRVRSLLCFTCNFRLGVVENHGWMQLAAIYLEKHNGR